LTPEDRLQAALERTPPHADTLALAYRDAAAALARARSDPAQAWREERLNALVGRAHARLFREPVPPGRRVWEFAVRGWAASVRAQGAWTVAAAGIFLAAMAAGYAAVDFDPDAAADLLSPSHLGQIAAWKAEGGWLTQAEGASALYVSYRLFRKNAGIALDVFASGIALGLGTVWRLLENGVTLGAIWASAQQAGALPLLASFTACHGPMEFSAIFLAGGAGMRMGWSLVAPGARGRRRALIEVGREAGGVMVGVVVMLLGAALIEGLVSPKMVGSWASLLVGGGILSGLVLWLRPRRLGRTQTGPEASSRR